MIEHMPSVTELATSDIIIGQRLRPVSDAQVSVLVWLIREHGFTVPVLVRRTRAGFTLIDGAHRLAAMAQLGHETLPVRAVRCTDDEARAMEAGQNLGGDGMSPLDDALFLAAYSAAYEEMHPETKAGTAGANAKHGILQTNSSSFAEMIAEKRAVTPRQIQKIAAAGRALGPVDVRQLRAAPRAVTLADLQVIAKCTAPERYDICAALAEGRARTAAKALKSLRALPGAAVDDPVEKARGRLADAWARASSAARKRFVADHYDEIQPLVSDVWRTRQTAKPADAARGELARRRADG